MMYLHALIAFLIVALTLSCPPPFNDVRFIGNSSYPSSQLIEAALLGQGIGWTETVTPEGLGNPEKPWPRNDNNEVEVTFCFETEEALNMVHDLFFDALEMWFDLGLPSKANQHGVRFNALPVLCTTEDGSWDTRIDPDAVLISLDKTLGSDAVATLGWQPTKGGIHKNHLIMNPDTIGVNDKDVVAHEIGHVLGLSHEHQRDDRDDYIDYKCENVRGYDEAKKKAEAEQKSMDEVCKSEKLCLKYGWDDGRHYAIDLWWNNAPKNKRKGIFDSKSIMLYDSDRGGRTDKDMSKYTDVPLVRWKQEGHDTHPSGRTPDNCEIYKTLKITKLDLLGVKTLYPWIDPPSYLGGLDMVRVCEDQWHGTEADVHPDKGCNGWNCYEKGLPHEQQNAHFIDMPEACVSQYGLGATAKCGPKGAFDCGCWRY